jgi:hypothetical protein
MSLSNHKPLGHLMVSPSNHEVEHRSIRSRLSPGVATVNHKPLKHLMVSLSNHEGKHLPICSRLSPCPHGGVASQTLSTPPFPACTGKTHHL